MLIFVIRRHPGSVACVRVVSYHSELAEYSPKSIRLLQLLLGRDRCVNLNLEPENTV